MSKVTKNYTIKFILFNWLDHFITMSSLTGLLSILSIFNNLYSFDIMVFLLVVGLWLSISALSLILLEKFLFLQIF